MTDIPQEDSKDENVVEQIDLTSTPEPEAAPEAAPTAEAPVPQLTLGQEGAAPAESAEEAAPFVQPFIRGRVDKSGTAIGTGRRKTAVARVRIKDGNGDFTINGRSLKEFLCVERDRAMVVAPLKAVDELGKVDVWVRVNGGGPTGQTGAIVLGVARALQARNVAYHPILAEEGYLTRDGRMVERKKYGKRKARRSFQFSKR